MKNAEYALEETQSFEIDDIRIMLNRHGSKNYSKLSYPVRYGIYSIIENSNYVYHFNRNGEVRNIHSKNMNWPRDEWLKRTAGNDWIYYTPGLYIGLQSYIGEYYLPCFSYPANSIFPYAPFTERRTDQAIESIRLLVSYIQKLNTKNIPEQIRKFLSCIVQNGPVQLKCNAKRLYDVLGGNISVLPPDSRHVDYDLVPLIIADGCLYNCSFCVVKNGAQFKSRKKTDIIKQVLQLRDHYAEDIVNYNSLFLGMHDAFNSKSEIIEYALDTAYRELNFKHSFMKGANLFLFASIASFMKAPDSLFRLLNRSPYYTYINIGLESADDETLAILKKPITENQVSDTFQRMQEINRNFETVEVTANVILSDTFPVRHYTSIVDLNRYIPGRYYEKGALYLSPLNSCKNIEFMKKQFIEIKTKMKLPVYLYLIQRL